MTYPDNPCEMMDARACVRARVRCQWREDR